jgi:hypothetical protein
MLHDMAQKSIDNWLSLAEYDLATAKALTETKASQVLESTRELFEWIKSKL